MKKILIIGPAWVGDMVMAQGLFRLLKQQQPEMQIDVLAPAWTNALLARMPEVHRALPLPFKHGELALLARWRLGKQLRAERYDQAIVLPNSWKSAIIPFAARIPQRTGWIGEGRLGLLNDCRKLNKKSLPLMLQRFAALGFAAKTALPTRLLKPKLRIDETARTQAQQKYSLTTIKPILALCPGAEFGPSKRWPAEYFAEVANHYLQQHWQVVIFGSTNDQPVAEEIQTLTHHCCLNVAGKTTLAEAIDLMSLATLVITNDSGLMHIAAALDKCLVALYGSTDPSFTPPLSDKAKILKLSLECQPCFQRNCPLKHHRCMRDLLPQRVIEACAECEF